MYITSGVCCWHSPNLISTWISLPPVSSTATLGLFLLITVIGHYFCSYFHPFLTQLHFTFLTPPFLLYVYLCCVSSFYAFTLMTNNKNAIQLYTGYRTTRLLGYRHPKTVLLWFLFTWILHWNLLHCHQTLPPLKVLDFPDMEHE